MDSPPLHFEKEFFSLNKVRNYLEHRNGVVGQRDLDKTTGMLELSLPCLKIFAEQDGTDIELVPGSRFEKDTIIAVKRVTRTTS